MVKEKKDKEKLRFFFPSKIAERMKKIDTRTQLEASMSSMALIMVGMLLLAVHQLIYSEQGWVFISLMVFNMLCGFLFLGSYLVTTYQQWVNHMEIMGIDPDKEKVAVKSKGNIVRRIMLAIRTKNERKKEEKEQIVAEEKAELDLIEDVDGKSPEEIIGGDVAEPKVNDIENEK